MATAKPIAYPKRQRNRLAGSGKACGALCKAAGNQGCDKARHHCAEVRGSGCLPHEGLPFPLYIEHDAGTGGAP